MKRKSLLAMSFLITCVLVLNACGGGEKSEEEKSKAAEDTPKEQAEVHGSMLTADDVLLETPLNQQWVNNGKTIYDMKCQSCHNLDAERKVGPGWKGLTQKREPHWIMNMITNVDMMLESDPEAQKLLEQCLVRMPNQNIDKDNARRILEFMRANDGVK